MPFANINFSGLIKLAVSFSVSLPLPLSLSRIILGETTKDSDNLRIFIVIIVIAIIIVIVVIVGGSTAKYMRVVLLYLLLGTCWPSCCWRPAWSRERNWRSRGYRGPRGIRPASASARLVDLRNVLLQSTATSGLR